MLCCFMCVVLGEWGLTAFPTPGSLQVSIVRQSRRVSCIVFHTLSRMFVTCFLVLGVRVKVTEPPALFPT